MPSQLMNWIDLALDIVLRNSGWMAWNSFLAFFPLALSDWLFNNRRGYFWLGWLGLLAAIATVNGSEFAPFSLIFLPVSYWLFRHWHTNRLLFGLGCFTFVAFLPNAPYVLTDIIHLIRDLNDYPSIWLSTLVTIPLYLVFIGSGFVAYVLSLIYLGDYLRHHGRRSWILGTELLLHVLSAVGIYLGRFIRLNSWDLVTQPDAVIHTVIHDLADKRPTLVIFITCIIMTVLYSLMKSLLLPAIERYQVLNPDPSRYADL
jgi:uncharacterized membrane protein